MSVAVLVLPDFLLVALGWLLRHRFGFSREFFAGLERLVYYLLLPALLFRSVLRVPLTAGAAADLIVATALVVGAGIALAWPARHALRVPAIVHASAAQCAYRFNTYIGLALAASLGGEQGQSIMALVMGFAVALGNFAAVWSLARHNGSGLLGELARNPLLGAAVAGLACNLGGLTLPVPVDTMLARLGAAAVALGILCVGAGLSWQAGKGAAPLMGWMLAIKLGILPAIALALGPLLGLPPLQQQMLVLFASLPTASASYVLAVRMGGDGPIAAALITLGTILSAATIPMWLAIAG